MQRESWEWIKWPESIMMWIFVDLFVSLMIFLVERSKWNGTDDMKLQEEEEQEEKRNHFQRRRRKKDRRNSWIGMRKREDCEGGREKCNLLVLSYEPCLCTKVKRLGRREWRKKRQDLESLSSSGRERERGISLVTLGRLTQLSQLSERRDGKTRGMGKRATDWIVMQ